MFSFFKKTTENISKILRIKKEKISKELLEEILIESDISYEIVEKILENLGENITQDELRVGLNRFFQGESYYDRVEFKEVKSSPTVYLIIGVNGAGKTTTIAKLAKKFKNENKKVLLGAGDTFRAAAVEQLELWSKKIGVDIVLSKQGQDPSALAFDAINAGIARGCDYVIIDSAGRLHNKQNLRNELIKISKTCEKALKQPFNKIIVLDGTQGSSSIDQARIFHEALDVNGLIVTKMDGTSRGGAIISIIHEMRLPVLFLGVGEGENDLVEFKSEDFIEGLITSIFK